MFIFPGMFPYVCLATMPLFCSVSWPRKLISTFTKDAPSKPGRSTSCLYEAEKDKKNILKEDIQPDLPTHINWKHTLVVCLLLSHCGLQVFLPYSHFITQVIINIQKEDGIHWCMKNK